MRLLLFTLFFYAQAQAAGTLPRNVEFSSLSPKLAFPANLSTTLFKTVTALCGLRLNLD